jgi:hypothetical protein
VQVKCNHADKMRSVPGAPSGCCDYEQQCKLLVAAPNPNVDRAVSFKVRQSGIPLRGCPSTFSRTSPACSPALSMGLPGSTPATLNVGYAGIHPGFAGPHASCRALKQKVRKGTAAMR